MYSLNRSQVPVKSYTPEWLVCKFYIHIQHSYFSTSDDDDEEEEKDKEEPKEENVPKAGDSNEAGSLMDVRGGEGSAPGQAHTDTEYVQGNIQQVDGTYDTSSE